MKQKQFKGKAIYNPTGKAAEYSPWACNFFTGCSNNCSYCYCRRGVLSAVWSDRPQLKKCFRNKGHAIDVFEKEMLQNKQELRKHGLFFSFTTDPMLFETSSLTYQAVMLCICAEIPVKILTKKVNDIGNFICALENEFSWLANWMKYISFGFTLTGCDDLELGASTNEERITAMKELHESGFKTFASIEPVINFESSLKMILETAGFCDLYKIGLLSGSKPSKIELQFFLSQALNIIEHVNSKVYLKDSIKTITKPTNSKAIVESDYNLFL